MPVIHPTLPADGDDAVVEPYNAAFALILGVLNGSIDSDNLADNGVSLAKLSAAVQGALTPSGAILAFGSLSAPTGFLVCDGSSYLRGTYPALFAVLGTSFGSADGTHFNVPDLRGRVPVGSEGMGGSTANRIERSTTITTTNASATATVGSAANLSRGMFIKSTNVPAGTTITNISGTTITMSANASASGTTIPARFSMLADAEVLGSAGGADVHTLVTAQLAAHKHSSNISDSTGGSGFNSLVRGTSTGNQTLMDNAGGDEAHPNMQPSLTVSYIIKT
jgi:microcystin-dependent protein